MNRRNAYRPWLRFVAALLLGAWAVTAIHALEHQSCGEHVEHPECVACAVFWGAALLVTAVALTRAQGVLPILSTPSLLRGTRLTARPFLRGPPRLQAA
jgi:hypothetical protein